MFTEVVVFGMQRFFEYKMYAEGSLKFLDCESMRAWATTPPPHSRRSGFIFSRENFQFKWKIDILPNPSKKRSVLVIKLRNSKKSISPFPENKRKPTGYGYL